MVCCQNINVSMKLFKTAWNFSLLANNTVNKLIPLNTRLQILVNTFCYLIFRLKKM